MEPTRICDPGGKGWFLPFYEGQKDWPTWFHGPVLALLMCYSFLGVSIVADAFMVSIERITACWSQVLNEDAAEGERRVKTTLVWNKTVATLSLMALGSSAPEIFLSLIDLLKREFHFSELGAATITGSAAFNLLVIVAVCVFAIPSNEIRQIQDLAAFYVTAGFSVLAYTWMWLIIVVVSYEIVEIWEAVITLMLMPALLYISYKVDVGDYDNICIRLGIKSAVEVGGRPHVVFAQEFVSVEATDREQKIELRALVVDVGDGLKKRTVMSYCTQEFEATEDFDFEGVDGEVEFSEDTLEQTIAVKILPGDHNRNIRRFLVIIEHVGLHNEIGFKPDTDGGADRAICTVQVHPPQASNALPSIERRLNNIVSVDSFRKGCYEWPAQFLEALYCHGSAEDQKEATTAEFIQHLVALPWKILWAFIPPTEFYHGWVAFFAALCGIAVMSALLSDLADMFGCVLGVQDIITAVTFVALGTSMPDLFASLQAARGDPTADASIVNVTGSNSVNVFLGLGLPWTVGTIYWQAKGRSHDWEMRYPSVASRIDGVAFVVNSQNLGFTVMCFMISCIAALITLYVRRKTVGGELGGKRSIKIATSVSFLAFWFGFVGISSWRVIRWDDMNWIEDVVICSLVLFIMLLFWAIPLVLMFRHWRDHEFKRMSYIATVGEDEISLPKAEAGPPEEPVPPPPKEVPQLKRSSTQNSCSTVGTPATVADEPDVEAVQNYKMINREETGDATIGPNLAVVV